VSLATDFRTFLLADATILAAVGSKGVAHNRTRQAQGFPQVCFFRRQTTVERTIEATSPETLQMVSFDVECVHTSLSGAETLAAAVRARCDSYRGSLGSGLSTVQGMFCEDQDEDYVPRADESDDVRHVVSFQVEIYP
jgi:hypothetical protein